MAYLLAFIARSSTQLSVQAEFNDYKAMADRTVEQKEAEIARLTSENGKLQAAAIAAASNAANTGSSNTALSSNNTASSSPSSSPRMQGQVSGGRDGGMDGGDRQMD